MARTPLASRVHELALSRRQFLGAAGASAASLAAWTPRARAATSSVDYTRGKIGDSFGPENGTATDRAKKLLKQIEPVLPGVTKQFDGNATVDYRAAYPWTLGSSSYCKPGQYTRFGGAEPELSGACHFAGEHTTQDFQGYLQGAVFSGNRAAGEVLDAL